MTFERLNYNTPIHYEHRPPCLSFNRLREIADDYCSWDNETAVVPAGFTNCVQIRRYSDNRDCLGWIKCALKVASYFTLIIPALMYLAKCLLRSSPFYVIPQAQFEPILVQPTQNVAEPIPVQPAQNIQEQATHDIRLRRATYDIRIRRIWENRPDVDVEIGRFRGQNEFTDQGLMYLGVGILNKKVIEFLQGSTADQSVLMHALIEKHHAELTSEAPLIVQQFFQKIATDPFVCHALCMAYRVNKLFPLDILQLDDKNMDCTNKKTGFERNVLETLTAYLAAKANATLTEKWIHKALTDQHFASTEFTQLDPGLQRDVCCIAKLFNKKVFWPLAESLLVPQTPVFQCTFPVVLSEQIMAYIGQPYLTAHVCRAWAHVTRNSLRVLLLDYCRDKEVSSFCSNPYFKIGDQSYLTVIKTDNYFELIFKLELLGGAVKSKLPKTRPANTHLFFRYLLTPFNIRTTLSLRKFVNIRDDFVELAYSEENREQFLKILMEDHPSIMRQGNPLVNYDL